MTTTPSQPLAIIIEDDAFLADLFAKALQEAEYRTLIVQDGKFALTRVRETNPAVVVLDLHLPHVSGKEILHQIRSDEQITNTPVMIITAYSHVAEALENEATLVLHKPATYDQVRDLAARLRPPDFFGTYDDEE